MFRKFTVFIAALMAVMMIATSAQAHTVTITPKGKIEVTNTNSTTTTTFSKSGGYRRVVVTSFIERKRTDGSTALYEATTSAKVRIQKCPKRAKRCVQQELKNSSRLIKVIPPATAVQVATPQPAPEGQTLPNRIYSAPTLSCTLPEAWIISSPPGVQYISTGVIWCEVQHDEDDPVANIVAVSPDAEPSRFVTSEYRHNYQGACKAPLSCFRAVYDLGTMPGSYYFRVTATTESGQQVIYEGNAPISAGYPTDSYK